MGLFNHCTKSSATAYGRREAGVLRVRSRKFAGVRGVLSATRRFVEAGQAENGCLFSV